MTTNNDAHVLTRLHARLVKQLEAGAVLGDFHTALQAAAEIKAVAAAIRALSADRGEAVAWMADDGRVIDAKAKAAGERSGGATKSAADAFSIPLRSFSAGHAASRVDVSDAALIAISKESVHGLRLAAMLRGDVNAMDFRAALFALIRELYAATPPSPADTSTGDDARHARENPPSPLPPATLLYENEGDGTKVYGYTAEQMQARVSPAESAERCPHCDDTGDVHRADGEWIGRCDCPAAAPSQVSDADVERVACRHLWSEPDDQGVQWCLFCDGKTGRNALGVQP